MTPPIADANGTSAPPARHLRLGDFTTDPRVLLISGIAVVVATAGVVAGFALLKLIRLATNIAYFGQLSFANLRLEHSPLGLWAVLVPVAGSLIVGLMARFGAKAIRRMEPRAFICCIPMGPGPGTEKRTP